MKLAEYLPIEVISMDSRQVYKYMDIGTGKPSKQIRAGVPHHLVDLLDPHQGYNAYLFRKDAQRLVKEILNRKKIPLVVGGTGLYADALLFGILERVPANDGLRKALLNLERSFPGILRRILERTDPVSAKRIHPNDIKRIVRAIEVRITMGKRISDLWKEQRDSLRESPFYVVVLERERKDLYGRISKRVFQMFKDGLIDEVERLLQMGYSPELDALKTIGYKEVVGYLEDKYSLSETVKLVQRHTRHYARRQIMWSRRYKEAFKLNLSNKTTKQIVGEMVQVIKSRLGG